VSPGPALQPAADDAEGLDDPAAVDREGRRGHGLDPGRLAGFGLLGGRHPVEAFAADGLGLEIISGRKIPAALLASHRGPPDECMIFKIIRNPVLLVPLTIPGAGG